MTRPNDSDAPATLRSLVREYARPDRRKALWQLANTLPPFVALWMLAVLLFMFAYRLSLFRMNLRR